MKYFKWFISILFMPLKIVIFPFFLIGLHFFVEAKKANPENLKYLDGFYKDVIKAYFLYFPYTII